MVYLTKAQARASRDIQSFARNVLGYQGGARHVTAKDGTVSGVMLSATGPVEAQKLFSAFWDLKDLFGSTLITDVEQNGAHVTVWHNAL